MDNLGLPHPKQMDVAVPANLRCGRPERDAAAPARAARLGAAHLHLRRHLGDRSPSALRSTCGPVQIVDVREPDEFDGAAGPRPGARAGAARRAGRARGRARADAAGRHRVPLRRALRAGRRAAGQGRLRRGRQPRGRHAALARARATRSRAPATSFPRRVSDPSARRAGSVRLPVPAIRNGFAGGGLRADDARRRFE